MAYAFSLNVQKAQSSLALIRDGVPLATEVWIENRDMGQRVFAAIAELLANQNLRPEQVSKFVVTGGAPDNSTSMRIAETVKRVYTFGATLVG